MKDQTITSKDEAKRELEKLKECAFLTPKVHQALDIAIESLDNEWVDVRDRLPSESGMYLVTVDEGYRKHTTEWFYGTSGEKGWDEDYGYENIIAWKPRPQPYERKE